MVKQQDVVSGNSTGSSFTLVPKRNDYLALLTRGEEWEVLQEDSGRILDFEECPTFVGRLDGVKVVDLEGPNGSIRPTNLYLFSDSLTGENVSVWANFQLDRALRGSDSPYLGRVVYLDFKGKREMSNGRTLNVLSVMVMRPVKSPIA